MQLLEAECLGLHQTGTSHQGQRRVEYAPSKKANPRSASGEPTTRKTAVLQTASRWRPIFQP